MIYLLHIDIHNSYYNEINSCSLLLYFDGYWLVIIFSNMEENDCHGDDIINLSHLATDIYL